MGANLPEGRITLPSRTVMISHVHILLNLHIVLFINIYNLLILHNLLEFGYLVTTREKCHLMRWLSGKTTITAPGNLTTMSETFTTHTMSLWIVTNLTDVKS